MDFSKWGKVTRKPFTPVRRTIARRMSESWAAIPHVTQFDEADVMQVLQLRKKLEESYHKKGAVLTVTGFILKAVTAALKKYPVFNTSLDEAAGELVFKEYVNLGIAVDTEAGLIVPVLRDADKKSMLEISKEVAVLAEKARERKLSAEEIQGGTFTISNQGGIGGTHFTPIINLPEVAILGVGRSSLKPVVVKSGSEKVIEPRMLLPLALSYDHRVIDGADAARFITFLKTTLEAFPESEAKL